MRQNGVISGDTSTTASPPTGCSAPWSAALRSVREACGLTQDRWAAFVGVSRKTIQRWEAGDAVPDARAEEAILALCVERRVLGGGRSNPPGVGSREALSGLLAAARLDKHGAARGSALAPPGDPGDERLFVSSAAGMFGREGMLELLSEAASVSRLVTLTGPGGVGKTTLASALANSLLTDADESEDDVVFVSLAALRLVSLVPAAIAAAVGVRQAGGSELRDALVVALGDRRKLLVLDNFEHLLGAAPVVRDLLVSCPRLRVIVTSRVPLGLPGEHDVVVPPLALPDHFGPQTIEQLGRTPAIALFVSRARAADPTFAVRDDTAADIALICRRLDGLPLAIELAAARIALHPPAAMLARLDERLRLLTGGPAHLPVRHRALSSTLEWSHELLSRQEQVAFRRMSVFAGAFGADAAVAIVGENADAAAVTGLLGRLVSHSLVQRELTGENDRWRLLETVREFAAERLKDSGERAETENRHRSWYLAAAEAASARLLGRDQDTALDQLTRDHPDIRAALERSIEQGATTPALRLSVALAPFWDLRSALTEARDWIDRSLALDGGAEWLRAQVGTWAAYLAVLQGDFVRATSLAAGTLAVWQANDIRQGIGYSLLVLGQAAVGQGVRGEGQQLMERSAEALRDAADQWGLVRALNCLGEIARMAGDFDAALRHHQEALALCRQIGDTNGLPNVLCGLAQTLLGRGRTEDAIAASLEGLAIAVSSANRVQTAAALEALAAAVAARDQPAAAAHLWGTAEATREAVGAPMEARDREPYRKAVEAVRAALGRERLSSEWASGRSVPQNDILNDARARSEQAT